MLKSYKAVLMASAVAVAIGTATDDMATAAPLNVSADVVTLCDINANPMTFGNVEAGQPATASAIVNLTNCTPGVGNSYKIIFNQGTFGDANTFRLAKNGDAALEKIGYTTTDAGSTGLFTGNAITPDVESAGTNAPSLDLNLSGTLDATDLNSASSGNYSDTIQITVDLT